MRVQLVSSIRRIKIGRTSLMRSSVVIFIRACRPSLCTFGEEPAVRRKGNVVLVPSRRRQRRHLIDSGVDIHIRVHGVRWASAVQEKPKIPFMTIRLMTNMRWIRDTIGSEWFGRNASCSFPNVIVRSASHIPDGRWSTWTSGIFSSGIFHGISDRYDILAAKWIAGKDFLYRTGENERSIKTTLIYYGFASNMHIIGI